MEANAAGSVARGHLVEDNCICAIDTPDTAVVGRCATAIVLGVAVAQDVPDRAHVYEGLSQLLISVADEVEG